MDSAQAKFSEDATDGRPFVAADVVSQFAVATGQLSWRGGTPLYYKIFVGVNLLGGSVEYACAEHMLLYPSLKSVRKHIAFAHPHPSTIEARGGVVPPGTVWHLKEPKWVPGVDIIPTAAPTRQASEPDLPPKLTSEQTAIEVRAARGPLEIPGPPKKAAGRPPSKPKPQMTMQQQFDFMGDEIVDQTKRVIDELWNNRNENARAAKEAIDAAERFQRQRDSAVKVMRKMHDMIGELLREVDGNGRS